MDLGEPSRGSMSEENRKVVICGGGVIGTAIAYYLAKRGQACTVVERDSIAAAASGRAGGFLALDWNDSSPVGPLARLSYKLHASLEQELGVDIGYRCVDTFSVQARDAAALDSVLHRGGGHKALGKWVDGHITSVSVRVRVLKGFASSIWQPNFCEYLVIMKSPMGFRGPPPCCCERLGDSSTTAQVHPKLLTEAFMAKASQLAGSKCVTGAVHDIQTRKDGRVERVSGVRVGEDVIPADVVVIAMGPWSQLASAWLPLPMAISGQKYHSAVLRPATDVPAEALFTNVRRGGVSAEPEIYPRPHGEVYVCGEPDTPPLPPSASQVVVNREKCENIVRNVSLVASCLKDAEVVAQQACYLPITPDGVPVLGEVPGVSGAYVATGHSCWGILNAPATGLAMSELIIDGHSSCVDLRKFSPTRFL